METTHFDYVKEAHVTASNKFYGELVPFQHLKNVMDNAIAALEDLDAIKKTLFYGKALPSDVTEAFEICEGVPQQGKYDNTRQSDIIHSILGIATESGELLEALYASLIDGNVFDEVNFAEELGDVFWYQALGIRATNETFDSIQRRNIAKLRARFPNKFTEFDANNRDLLTERAILEYKIQPNVPTYLEADRINEVASKGLKIEVSGSSACGKTLAAECIKRLIPNANVVDKSEIKK